MSTRASPPPEALRFLRESRGAHGQATFLKYLATQREESLRIAIYGSDKDAREINAGRVQAWTEILALFTDS